jgi:hypothetical protein
MNDIDALTLQLLSSKKRYNKYLESAQPNKSNEIQEFYGKIRKYKSRILQTVEKYLDTPETQTTTDVDESIEACFKTLIRHYEILNKERKAYLKDYDEDDSTDEEEVFGQTKEEAEAEAEEAEEAEEVEETTNKKPQVSSFWGNQITKTPSPNLDAFIIKKSKNK